MAKSFPRKREKETNPKSSSKMNQRRVPPEWTITDNASFSAASKRMDDRRETSRSRQVKVGGDNPAVAQAEMLLSMYS